MLRQPHYFGKKSTLKLQLVSTTYSLKPFVVKGFSEYYRRLKILASRLAIIIVPNKNIMDAITDKKKFTQMILNKTGIQVVKFYADWSGPCQMMAPIYKELSLSYTSAANFFMIDVEASPALKKEFGVNELPTILFYKNGAIIDFVNGMIPKNVLIAKLENIINQKN
jgi:thioredoxin 1